MLRGNRSEVFATYLNHHLIKINLLLIWKNYPRKELYSILIPCDYNSVNSNLKYVSSNFDAMRI